MDTALRRSNVTSEGLFVASDSGSLLPFPTWENIHACINSVPVLTGGVAVANNNNNNNNAGVNGLKVKA